MADAGTAACFRNAVGVANPRIILDKQMTCSFYDSTRSSFRPAHARLNSNSGYGWCAYTIAEDIWLQVDLGQLFKVCGVAIQGSRRINGVSWYMRNIKWSFKLTYSQDGKNWTTYKDENGNEMEFHSQSISTTVHQLKLKPLSARYLRFIPTELKKWCCLRVEVYGTTQDLVINSLSPSDCGIKLTKRVVGGQHASPGEWRWHALVETSLDLCGGSLLTPQWVITAAHCVKGKSAANFDIALGQHTRSKDSGKGQVYSISKIIIHPEYDREKIDYGFALLKLAKPATMNEHVATICLPESSQKLPIGTTLWATGWGRTSDAYRAGGSDVLKEVEMVIVPPNVSRFPTSISEFIAVGIQEGHGTCQGDSGGPAVHEQNGRWYLEGVHSWGSSRSCADPDTYKGEADVRAVLPWITNTIKNSS
ncbi:chymotrypsinogen B-like [Oculina patagonica]